MSPTSRRIFAYWLLLLLPTVGVGLAALYLLRREQTRLEERATYADESRKAAVTARAQLIAENVELLVGDVQTGLLDQLATEPTTGLDQLLDQLEKFNPLVRAVFRSDDTGRIVRPAAATADEEGRAFLRRFGPSLTGTPPWKQEEKKKSVEIQNVAPQSFALVDEQLARQEITQNVSKVQQARRDTRELASKSSSYSAPPAAKPSDSYSSASPVYNDAARQQSGPAAAAEGKRKLEAVDDMLGKKAEVLTPARRGWLPVKREGRLHLLGWIQPAGLSEVRGLELEMAALISRLGGALPEELSGDVGYALRDDQGRILHQAGAIPREWAALTSLRENRLAEPSVRIPLAADLLPGWDVVAFIPTAPGKIQLGGGFLVVGTLLVGIFLVAIVTGGWLLLRQARQSEAEAVQKTSFVANVSHEFKTPLTTIRLYSELLEQGRVKDAAQGGEYLRTIGRETERLARLVGNALDFSRLEQGKKKYARDDLDLSAELTRLLDTQMPRLADAGLVLQRELPAKPLMVKTDHDAFAQIILNLIDNAAKYGAAGGGLTVELMVRRGGVGAIVRVLDRGPGVPREHWEKIFDKFHRVDDTLTAEKTGTGLGLSIARQLARGLGGELRHAPRDGGGASFILELP